MSTGVPLSEMVNAVDIPEHPVGGRFDLLALTGGGTNQVSLFSQPPGETGAEGEGTFAVPFESRSS